MQDGAKVSRRRVTVVVGSGRLGRRDEEIPTLFQEFAEASRDRSQAFGNLVHRSPGLGGLNLQGQRDVQVSPCQL